MEKKMKWNIVEKQKFKPSAGDVDDDEKRRIWRDSNKEESYRIVLFQKNDRDE